VLTKTILVTAAPYKCHETGCLEQLATKVKILSVVVIKSRLEPFYILIKPKISQSVIVTVIVIIIVKLTMH